MPRDYVQITFWGGSYHNWHLHVKCILQSEGPHQHSLCNSYHNDPLLVTFWTPFGIYPAPKASQCFWHSETHFTFTIQSRTCDGSLVSGWWREPDTGPRRQTVAIWILFNVLAESFIVELLCVWTRDGCTGSQQAWQEVNKSKAGGPEKGRQDFPLIFSSCVLPSKYQLWYLLVSSYVHVETKSWKFVYRLVCCSLYKKENVSVQLLLVYEFPVASLLYIS